MKIIRIIFLLNLLFALNSSPLFAQNESNFRKLSELDSLTILAINSGNSEKAVKAATESKIYAEKYFANTDSLSLRVCRNYASALILAGQYSKAETILIDAYNLIDKNFPNSSLAAELYGLRGMNSYYTGNHQSAEAFYLKQIELLKKLKNNRGLDYAEALNNLGVLYAEQKRFEEAEPFYILSKNIRKDILGDKHSVYGKSLNNLAMLYKNLNRYEEAELLYLENLNIQKKLSESSYALSLNNLAIYYSVTGQEKKALPLLLEAAEIRKRILGAEHPDYARIMHNLGEAYNFFKDYKESEKYFLKAVEIREKLFQPHHPDLLESYTGLSFVYFNSGDTIKMWNYIGKSFENNGFKGSFPSNFDDAFRMEMEKTEFLNISKAIGSLNFMYSYFNAKIKASENDLELKKQALNVCKTVLSLEDKYRLTFATETDKLRSASELIRWNKYAMGLLFELNKFENVSGAEAFSISERNKSIILLNTLKAQHAAAFGELPDSLVNEERNLQKALSQIQKKLIETKDEKERTALLENQNNLRTTAQNFRKKLEEKYPKYYSLKYSVSNIKTSQLQKSLPKDAMMIEYYIADSVIYIFTLTRDEIKILKELIDPELLKNQIKTLRRSLSDYDYIKSDLIKSSVDYTQSAVWFYEKLLSNALKSSIAIQHLIIIPDAELGHIPFEVFLTEKTKSTDFSKMPYLLNKYKISYNYSAALWLENLEQIKNKNNAKVFAAAALYSHNNDKLRAPKERAINLLNIRNKLSDLPQARKEIEALEKLFYGKFLSGTTAVESEFKANASEYAVIHLAMHGLLNTQYPILSSLAFTENGDSIEDNFLQAYEISNMKLNAQLVVLSACETGYGRFQQGEGVISLARSFMYAGVPSLVVSLWQVNDASTAKIMMYFYKNLAAGLDKAEALRQAKLKYISENMENAAVMAHPAFWAAFVQLGDSRPIKLQQKTSKASFVLISLAIAAGIILSIVILTRKL